MDFKILNDDLLGVLSRAKSEGVTKMLTIGTNFKEISQTLSISERFEEIFFAAGIHPNQPSENLVFNIEYVDNFCREEEEMKS